MGNELIKRLLLISLKIILKKIMVHNNHSLTK